MRRQKIIIVSVFVVGLILILSLLAIRGQQKGNIPKDEVETVNGKEQEKDQADIDEALKQEQADNEVEFVDSRLEEQQNKEKDKTDVNNIKQETPKDSEEVENLEDTKNPESEKEPEDTKNPGQGENSTDKEDSKDSEEQKWTGFY